MAGKTLKIDTVDNGWVCAKIVAEGQEARVAAVSVAQTEEELIAWVKKNR